VGKGTRVVVLRLPARGGHNYCSVAMEIERLNKLRWILPILSPTLYAPVELSRLIIIYGLSPVHIFEISGIWIFYFLAIFIFVKEVR